MTDLINALVRSRHSLYMFVSATEHFLQCEFGIRMARAYTNMAEFQEGAVVCPCTDNKQFGHFDSFLTHGPVSSNCEFGTGMQCMGWLMYMHT